MLPFARPPSPLVSFVAGPLYDRVGAKRLAVLGAACITRGAGPLLAGRRRLRLRRADRRDARPRDRDRQLLPDRDHRRGHLGRRTRRPASPAAIVYMFQIAGGSIGLGLTTTVFSASPPFSTASRRPSGSTPALALIGLPIARCFVGGTLAADGPAGAAGDAGASSGTGRFRPGRRPGCSAEAAVQLSSPLPPSSLSSPAPPISRSLPPRPSSSSSPGAADQLVVAGAAGQDVVPAPPRIVAGTGIVVPRATLSLPPPVLISKPATGPPRRSALSGFPAGFADVSADFERRRRFDFVVAAVGRESDRDPVSPGPPASTTLTRFPPARSVHPAGGAAAPTRAAPGEAGQKWQLLSSSCAAEARRSLATYQDNNQTARRCGRSRDRRSGRPRSRRARGSSRSPRRRTGASVVSAITARSPPASAPTAAEMMLTPSSPKAVPTRPIIPGRSA